MSNMGDEPGSVAGGRLLPPWARSAAVAQVVGIAAGFLALACGLVMWRDVGYTMAVYNSPWSFPLPATTPTDEQLAVVPAAAAMLVALVALALRGRARWLHYPQIGLWLLVLASSIYIARACAPVTGTGMLYGPLLAGDVPVVVTVALLTLSLRRPARWHLAFVLVAVAVPCLAATCTGPGYGPGSGTLTGIVTKCTTAELKAVEEYPDAARFATVSVQNQAGRTVASQRLPLRTSGARYRMRLLAGFYSVNVITESGLASEDGATIMADSEAKLDFNQLDTPMCL